MEQYLERAIRCGPIPKVRNWRALPIEELTTAEQVLAFGEHYLKVPSGVHAGKPLRFEPFQEIFIYAVFDNPHKTRTAILSMARRNSKSFLTAVILLAFVIGPLSEPNISVASAANSRDQAGLIARMMFDMIYQSDQLSHVVRVVPSSKKCFSLVNNAEYYSMSADARTGFGRSLKVVVLDEAGQIKGPDSDYTSMLRSSQGSYNDALFITISTQAANDADYLSVLIDDAIRSQDPHTVCHLYTTPPEFDLLDEEGWKFSNPALGVFRNKKDLQEQLLTASRIPAQGATAENLLLNRRVALEKLWLAPEVWKKNSKAPNLEAFRNNKVSVGLDLSARQDLTAAVAAAQDDLGQVHLLPFIFCPLRGIEERSRRDKAPYDLWVRDGFLIPVGGETMDYEQIFIELTRQMDLLNISPMVIEFDRWRIDQAKREAELCGFASGAEWHAVGQGFKDFSPRCESFESLLLEQRIQHGNHPLLTMAAANAIAVKDPAGNTKLDKSKVTARIDPIIAAIMAVFAVTDGRPVVTQSIYDDLSREIFM